MILNVLISIIPLIVISSSFEIIKVFAFLLLGILLVFYLIFNYPKVIIARKDYYYLLWLVTLLVSGLLGEDPKASILGGSYRHQGFVFFFCLYLLIKYVQTLTEQQNTTLYKYVGIIVLIESLLVIFGFKLGTIGEINAVAGFLAIGFYFVKLAFPKLLLSFPVVAIITNFSKSGIFALLPYVLKKVSIVWIVVAVISIFIFKPVNTTSLFESRGVIWNYAVEIINDNPLMGYGAESNERLFDQKFLEDNIILTDLMIDRAHNLFLDITIWSGLIGLFFFATFLLESFKSVGYEKRQVLLSFLIYSMFQPLSIVHWILFALVV
jgi:O-antigen ligase